MVHAEAIALASPWENRRPPAASCPVRRRAGTMLAGLNAACSTSAWKFSGVAVEFQYADIDQRESVGIGQTLVRSNG